MLDDLPARCSVGHRRLIFVVLLFLCLSGGALSAQDARKELAGWNIPWTSSAFVDAAKSGDLRVVKLFLESGMNPDERSAEGYTALFWAVMKERRKVVELLSEKKANPNASNEDGSTALMVATTIELAQLLLSHGAAINAKTGDGQTPLLTAVQMGNQELVQFYLERGANPNLGRPPLVEAAMEGKLEIVRLLLSNKPVDLNSWDNEGRAVLNEAIKWSSPEIVQLLLDHGADVNVNDSRGESPLIAAAYSDKEQWIAPLVAKGADVNAMSRDGMTPLRGAQRHMNPTVVEFLTRNGALEETGISSKVSRLLDSLAMPSDLRQKILAEATREHSDPLALKALMRLLESTAPENGEALDTIWNLRFPQKPGVCLSHFPTLSR